MNYLLRAKAKERRKKIIYNRDLEKRVLREMVGHFGQ